MSCFQNNPNPVTENLVFLNKVFYDNSGTSCPVIYPITTDSANFTHQLLIGQNNCGCCCDSGFDYCNAVFTVTNTCATVTAARLSPESTFDAADITIDGLPVTSLELQDGRYYADLSGIMAEITACPGTPSDRHICQNSSSCDDCNIQCENGGHFFLASVPGPWEIFLNIVIDGYVSNGRTTTDFKLCIKSAVGTAGKVPVTVNASNNFALYCVDIPCQSQGIAPALRFNFDACAMLLNPVITVTQPAAPPAAAANVCPAPPDISLTASLVLTPKINLQIVRPSLFAINATEVDSCCDDLGQCDNCVPTPPSCIRPVPCTPAPCTPPQCPPSQCTAEACITSSPCQCCETNGYRF